MHKELITNHIQEHLQLISKLDDSFVSKISDISSILSQRLESGSRLFFCGNGGSASDSQHLAAELIGRFSVNRKPLRALALNTDTSVLTCISNDFSYDDIFSRQLEALACHGDVLIALSTSGDSKNVNNAISQANSMGVTTIALLGKSGGKSVDLANYSLVVPSKSTARIQECHILLGHILCDLIEQELGLV